MDPNEAVSGWRVAQWVSSALGGLTTLFVVFLAGLGRYHVKRLDENIDRVHDIREKFVTWEQFLAFHQRADNVINERHSEHLRRYEEAAAWQRRMEALMSTNAELARNDRHAAQVVTHEIALQVATLVGREQAKGNLP